MCIRIEIILNNAEDVPYHMRYEKLMAMHFQTENDERNKSALPIPSNVISLSNSNSKESTRRVSINDTSDINGTGN